LQNPSGATFDEEGFSMNSSEVQSAASLRVYATPQVIARRLDDRGRFYIAEHIAKKHSMSVLTLLGRCRTASVARAREELYAALRKTALSYPEVGYLVDRDHTTVLYAVRRFEEKNPHYEPELHVRIAV
jgi:hypothetical protein